MGVGQHLVMVAMLLDTDIVGAQAHAETAVRRAGRVPAAREALGLVAYRKGDWALALSEFRTARRLSGSSHMLPLMVDAERGLGRTERALDLASSPEARTLGLDSGSSWPSWSRAFAATSARTRRRWWVSRSPSCVPGSSSRGQPGCTTPTPRPCWPSVRGGRADVVRACG